MSTYTLGENITSTAKTDAQPVEAGIYMVAASAEGTISLSLCLWIRQRSSFCLTAPFRSLSETSDGSAEPMWH